MDTRRSATLRVIAVFKLVKALLLVAVGVGVLELLHRDVAETIAGWIRQWRVDPDNLFVQRVIAAVSGLSEKRLEAVSAGTFVYAAVLLIEGVGLLLEQTWAGYFTILATGGLIPLEAYELARRVTPTRVIALAVNAAIVLYLVIELRRERQEVRVPAP